MNSGFIQLHRKLLEWEWWDDHNTTRLFLYCLLKANWKPNNWKGVYIDRGQFPTGLDALSKEIGLSKQQIRTCLKKLQKSENINIQTTNKFSVVTVVNFDSYQNDNIKSTHKSTHEQQTNNKQITTLEEGNKYNKEINILFEDFWVLFPRKRRGDKQKGLRAFERALKKDSYENIMDGLRAYAKSDEVAKGFAKGCEAWLNDSRWLNEYTIAEEKKPIPEFRGMFG